MTAFPSVSECRTPLGRAVEVALRLDEERGRDDMHRLNERQSPELGGSAGGHLM